MQLKHATKEPDSKSRVSRARRVKNTAYRWLEDNGGNATIYDHIYDMRTYTM